MSATRIIITEASVWTLDFDRMEFRRDPRVEGFEHTVVRYTGDWRPFDYLTESNAYPVENRIRFIVHGTNLDGMGSDWVTSTYAPADQGLVL